MGEKRKTCITELVLSALPAGATVGGARATAGAVASTLNPKWGDLLGHQLLDSALVPVTMVLVRQAVAHGAAMGGVRVGAKAIPVIGAIADGAVGSGASTVGAGALKAGSAMVRVVKQSKKSPQLKVIEGE